LAGVVFDARSPNARNCCRTLGLVRWRHFFLTQEAPMNRWPRSLTAIFGVATGILLGYLLARSQMTHTEPSLSAAEPAARPAVPPDDGKLRIICFGAHPDDCEIRAGGVGAMWAAKGHHVKFVSVTNGDIGHWRDAGGPLAHRRKAEVEKAARIL